MKRIALFLIAAIFLIIFILSSNSVWMKEWVKYRSAKLKLPSDKYRFGDLYGFSYLPKFKRRPFSPEDVRPYYVQQRPATNVELYSICDSYLWTFMPNDSLFQHADVYRFTRWDYEAKKFHLDPSKKNILLIEMVERRVRYTIPDTTTIYKHLGVVGRTNEETVRDINPTSWLANHIFNKNIEENLEYNLFDYPLFTRIKEWKAQFNYSIFNRKSQDVFISNTREQLYYAPTVDSTSNTSSFKYLDKSEVDALVLSLNQVYRHYRKAGFSEIYLAIMPNPVTILEPNLISYNGLIPRIQQHPAMQMPVINIYERLQQIKNKPIYQVSDSHWSKEGFLAGIAQIDSVLAAHGR